MRFLFTSFLLYSINSSEEFVHNSHKIMRMTSSLACCRQIVVLIKEVVRHQTLTFAILTLSLNRSLAALRAVLCISHFPFEYFEVPGGGLACGSQPIRSLTIRCVHRLFLRGNAPPPLSSVRCSVAIARLSSMTVSNEWPSSSESEQTHIG